VERRLWRSPLNASSATPSIAFCTIASANYLDRVQTLLQSIERHHPGAAAFVLLCETPEVCRRLSAETGVAFWSPADVCDTWRDMAFYYNIVEFNTALKPFFLEKLLDRGHAAVIYLDPDIEVYGSLDPLRQAVATHDIVLTPHVCAPIPDDGCTPAMDAYIRAGQFNLGFVGVAGSANARALLRWWQSVCLERCLFESEHRFFVDQFWAAAFASFAERCCILRDPGYNVAYWNLFQREITRAGEQWQAGGQPLVFFHFSGLSEDDLTRVSRHQNRVRAAPGSPLHDLLAGYRQRVQAMPWHRYAKVAYSLGAFADGGPIAPEDRRNYLYLGAADRRRIGDPFANAAAIRNIFCINLSQGPRAYLGRIRAERAWRRVGALAEEFRFKVRTRGWIGATRIAVRFVVRKIVRAVLAPAGLFRGAERP
jgi:hypothetical protein